MLRGKLSSLMAATWLGMIAFPLSAEPLDLQGAVNRSIDDVIVPGYEALAGAATEQADAISALCDAPGAVALTAARTRFQTLVAAFSRMEPFRFGPAREDNRIERLFFWPDPRGRGLRQVQRIVDSADESATDRHALQQKSVAVQGLPALEFTLFGTGSETLADGRAPHRCRYARATANAIADVAIRLRDDWSSPDGYASRLRHPAEDNSIYRNADEAMQELLKAARQQLQATADLKLEIALGDAPQNAKPKTLPFWRSGHALRAIENNLIGVNRLIAVWQLGSILDRETALIADQLHRELGTALDAIAAAQAMDEDVLAVVESSNGHSHLVYAGIPVRSAIALLSEDIATALGLTVGFNALDGD